MLPKAARLSVAQKLAVICVSFSLPLSVMMYFVVDAATDSIRFARLEEAGNRYLRPLSTLLEAIPRHAGPARELHAGRSDVRPKLDATQAEVAEAFATLAATDAAIGAELQFTNDGLAKRHREHARISTVKAEWDSLRNALGSLTPDDAQRQHAHLLADIRTMITHAGDTSNLILDPDLDSYYLVDVTLGALPQMQERLARVAALGESVARRGAVTNEERSQLALSAAFLQEVDLDRVEASSNTALNEDGNFYGSSESLQKNLPPLVKAFGEATRNLIKLTNELAAAPKPAIAPADYAAAAAQASATSFALWRGAVAELDVLLATRTSSFQRSRMHTVAWSLVALVGSLALAWFIARGLNVALTRLVGQLGAFSSELESAAGQVSKAGQSLAEGTSKQAASLEETSSSLIQLSSMTKRTAEGAAQAKELSGQTRAAADTGAVDMEQMKSAMDSIKFSSGEIAKIVKIIDEIAFQTNILALNAAVEAARAGESGAGFAVVAEEVRSLAQRSAQSARETAAKIEDSVSKSEHGVQISEKVATSLQQIVDCARRMDTLIAEIAQASNEQSNGISQVNSAVSLMDKVTQDNAANAEETAASAEELSAQTIAMQESTAELRSLIGGVPAQAAPPKAAAAKAAHAEIAGTAPRRLQRPVTSSPAKENVRQGDFFKNS